VGRGIGDGRTVAEPPVDDLRDVRREFRIMVVVPLGEPIDERLIHGLDISQLVMRGWCGAREVSAFTTSGV